MISFTCCLENYSNTDFDSDKLIINLLWAVNKNFGQISEKPNNINKQLLVWMCHRKEQDKFEEIA